MNNKIFILSSLLLTFLLIACSAGGGLGGQLAPSSHPLMVNSWYQEGIIHVCISNTGDTPLRLIIGPGTYLAGDRIFTSRELKIDANSIRTMELPVSTKSFKGAEKVSDTVFVYQDTGQDKELLSTTYVQGLHPATLGYAAGKYFIIHTDKAGFVHYVKRAAEGISLVLVSKRGGILTGQRNNGSFEVIETSADLKPIDTEELKNLNIPEKYKIRISDELKSYYGFLADPAENKELSFLISPPSVAKSAILTIDMRRYDFLSAKEVSHGGMQGPRIMICNPERMAGCIEQ